MESKTGQVINLGSLYHRFEGLQDKRKAKGKRYALATILVTMFLAKLCAKINRAELLSNMLGNASDGPHGNTADLASRWDLKKGACLLTHSCNSKHVMKINSPHV